MSSSTAKTVVLYRFDRQPQDAVVHSSAYLQAGHVEVISGDGILQIIDLKDLKALCFATDRSRPDLFTESSVFERRPKLAGLWTRFRFRDGDRLDGLLPHRLLDWPRDGYLVTPPRAGSARQRVFIPREALSGTELLGVIGSPAGKRRARNSSADPASQLTMFE